MQLNVSLQLRVRLCVVQGHCRDCLQAQKTNTLLQCVLQQSWGLTKGSVNVAMLPMSLVN